VAAALTLGACNQRAGTAAPAAPAAAVPATAAPAAAAAPPTPPGPSPGPSAANAAEGQVRAFLTSVYTDAFSDNPRLTAQAIYDPALVVAIAKHDRLASQRNDAESNWDNPITQSPTPVILNWKITSLALSSPITARATIALSNPPDIPDLDLHSVTVLLVETPSGWRIHDMSTTDTPSFRVYLTKPGIPTIG